MTCEEFERVLPELGDSHNLEQEAHLKSCSACSDLLSDLNAIAQQAQFLQPFEEPSPRVWNSIEITLRQEGLISQPGRERSSSPTHSPLSWKIRWLVPAAAALLVGFGVLLHQRNVLLPTSDQQPVPVASVTTGQDPAIFGTEDAKLLATIAESRPSMRAAYEADLRNVNDYVRDAELMTKNAPNDEVAQQYLVNAYEQRAMVYEMALDRSLP